MTGRDQTGEDGVTPGKGEEERVGDTAPPWKDRAGRIRPGAGFGAWTYYLPGYRRVTSMVTGALMGRSGNINIPCTV
jgi:hypothetical protein